MSIERSASVSLRELKEICRKGPRDFFWISNLFWRPFSIYGTWLAVRLGIRSNTVTTVSCLFAIGSSFVLLFPSARAYIASVVLMQLFFFLDHVDGEVARYHIHAFPERPPNQSGSYYDLLVHYLQGASFFFCLGAGLSRASGEIMWTVAGVCAAVGCSSFPRFVAAYYATRALVRSYDDATRRVGEQVAEYYSIYWQKAAEPRGMYLVPRSVGELVFAVRQLLWFPGHLFVFAGAVIVVVALRMDLTALKVFLLFYASVLAVNTVYATRRYMRYLTDLR